MANKRTRADILREIADLEDELARMDQDYLNVKRDIPKLNSEETIDRINVLRRKLVTNRDYNAVNLRAYEYHIVSDVELDFERIVREGIKGILL